MTIERAQRYLTEFFNSHIDEYREIMNDAHPQLRRAPTFDGENEVIQFIRDTVHLIEEDYLNLSIPNKYPSPRRLVERLQALHDAVFLRRAEILEIQQRAKEWYSPLGEGYKLHDEVHEALSYGLSLIESTDVLAQPPLDRLHRLAKRLPAVAKQLTKRRHELGKPRETLSVKDEYDVQDLLHAVLRIDFDDIRPEECDVPPL